MFFPPVQPQTSIAADPSPSPFREVTLRNGLRLRFVDASNRYFGDYHRVRIEVAIELPLTAALLPDPELLAAGINRFGPTLLVGKVLERMGVASGRVETVRSELVEGYLHEARQYLVRPETSARLLRAELQRSSSLSTRAK